MTIDERSTAGQDAASGWSIVDRVRFHPLWDQLPALTVLSALPGWGRTEWLRQCAARIALREPDTMVLQPSHRAEAGAILESAPAGAVVLLDDVLLGRDDPLWAVVTDAAARGVRVVADAIDTPRTAHGPASIRVLDERDLRFTTDELSELLDAEGIPVGTDTRDDLDLRLKGCPRLVRRQLERLRARHGERVWAGIALTVERPLVDTVVTLATAHPESTFLGLLRRGAGFRRFSSTLVGSEDDVDAAQFDRLEAVPLGSFDVCDETGEQDYVWTTAAWQGFDDIFSRREREHQLEAALRRTAEAGRVTAQLFPLLDLGRVDDAERLVFDEYRRFLLFTDAVTQEVLLAESTAVSGHPSLMLLAGELRLRTRGANPRTVVDAAQCYDLFAPAPTASAVERFRLHCRRAMAAAYAGRRATAVRHLDKLADQLDPGQPSRLRHAAAADRGLAARIAADLFLAFWAAVQTDRHDVALFFVDVMREYGDPADLVTRIDRLTAMTEEDFAGLRSLDPDGARPDGLEYSHAAPLVLIEEGDDREALERTHPLAARVRPAPTRSAADALLVLTRALVAPEKLDRALVDAAVALSASFWDDARPSSFIAFAAAVAHLAAGRTAEARAVVERLVPDDWFALTAAALTASAADAPDSVLDLLDRGGSRTTLPRLRVVTGVLAASALLKGGLTGAAVARLQATWSASPAPRLLRFALRFLDAEAFAALAAAADATVDAEMRSVLRIAAGDRRPAPTAAPPALSPVERQILALLRRGLGNAEIATARGVSHNTIRTQIRLLYRKLGVGDRAEAVAAAERLRLLDV